MQKVEDKDKLLIEKDFIMDKLMFFVYKNKNDNIQGHDHFSSELCKDLLP